MNEQAGDDSAPHIRISSTDEIAKALDRAGLRRGRMVVVIVGGAGRMAEKDFEAAAEVLRKEVMPIVELRNAVVIDGGTDSGVMRSIGQARAQLGGRFPLVGVAAEGTVVGPDGESASPDAAGLEPNHTLFLIVPGSHWGDEVTVDRGRRHCSCGRPDFGHPVGQRRPRRLHRRCEKPRQRSAGRGARRKRSYRRRHRPSTGWARRRSPRRRHRGVATDESCRHRGTRCGSRSDRDGPGRWLARISHQRFGATHLIGRHAGDVR